jgi:hypothetical protein
VHLPGEEVGQRDGGAAIRHVQYVKPELLLEQLHPEMLQGADAGRRIIELARLGPGRRDQLGHGIDRQHGGIDGQRDAAGRDHADRREARKRIEAQGLEQARIDRVRRAAHQHGVAVRRGVGDDLRAERAACARLVVDHHRLSPALGELLSHRAGDDVEAAARRIGNDQRDALGGIGLRGDRCRKEDRQQR